jgi:hypothetical protein
MWWTVNDETQQQPERREHDDGYDFVWLPQKWRKRVMGEDPMRKGPG